MFQLIMLEFIVVCWKLNDLIALDDDNYHTELEQCS